MTPYPKEDVILLDEVTKVTFVDIPQVNILQGLSEIYGTEAKGEQPAKEGILDKYNLRGKAQYMGMVDGQLEVLYYEDYLKNCNIVVKSCRSFGSVNFEGGTKEFGTQHWKNLDDYFMRVSEREHKWLYAKLIDFKSKAIPDFEDFLTTEEGGKKVDEMIELLVKKNINGSQLRTLETMLNSISFETCRSLLSIMGSRFQELLEKNSLIFSSFNKPLLKEAKSIQKEEIVNE